MIKEGSEEIINQEGNESDLEKKRLLLEKAKKLQLKMKEIHEKGGVEEINEQVQRFSNYLSEKYGPTKIQKYSLYHVLKGEEASSLEEYDFEGDDSIEEIINNEERLLKPDFFNKIIKKWEKEKEFRAKVNEMYKKGGKMEVYDRLQKFTTYLWNKYGRAECEKYSLYHVLVGSNVYSKLEKYDFEGDDSIEKIINEEKLLDPNFPNETIAKWRQEQVEKK